MTVCQLIEELSKLPENAAVCCMIDCTAFVLNTLQVRNELSDTNSIFIQFNFATPEFLAEAAKNDDAKWRLRDADIKPHDETAQGSRMVEATRPLAARNDAPK